MPVDTIQNLPVIVDHDLAVNLCYEVSGLSEAESGISEKKSNSKEKYKESCKPQLQTFQLNSDPRQIVPKCLRVGSQVLVSACTCNCQYLRCDQWMLEHDKVIEQKSRWV